MPRYKRSYPFLVYPSSLTQLDETTDELPKPPRGSPCRFGRPQLHGRRRAWEERNLSFRKVCAIEQTLDCDLARIARGLPVPGRSVTKRVQFGLVLVQRSPLMEE